MIRKAVLLYFSLLIGYLILVLINPKLEASQTQGQDNLIKAQKFIYSNTQDQKKIIVGSSLSATLSMRLLPHITNLSFIGYSIFDGLYMIEQSRKKPDVVFIEMNFLQRAGDKQFQESIYTPVSYYSRKYIPLFREEKQPLTNIGRIVLYALRNTLNAKVTEPQLTDKISNSQANTKNNLLANLLPDIIKSNSVPFPDNLLKDRLKELTNYVNYLKRLNTKVIFFEMPVNYQLTNLVQQVTIREAFFKTFPKETNLYINLPVTNYVTADGWHMDEEEIQIYTKYFKDKADILIHK